MHEWLVAGAVIEGPDGLLLVQNLRRNGELDWTPPGGVIDAGEDLVAGLAREVLEETGLTVTGWVGPLYEVTVDAPDMGWRMRAEIHAATSFGGDLCLTDPDGIVVDARFVPVGDHAELLASTHPWVREPLCDWLEHRAAARASYRYSVAGDRVGSAVVTRHG